VVYSFKGADMSLGGASGYTNFADPAQGGGGKGGANLPSLIEQPLPQFTGDDPYSQIMAMTPAFRNPYENFVPGTALGGFDPNLYTSAIQDINNNLYGTGGGDGGGDSSPSTSGDGGVSGGGGGGAATDGGEGFSAANSADFGDTSSSNSDSSSEGDAGAAGGGGGGAADDGGTGSSDGAAAAGDGGSSGGDGGGDGGAAGAAWAMGGLIDRVGGPNPPGPDDGTGYLDLGEYVIRKSSVKKYGRGLLDMINEGKVPAKKIKSLLD